MNAYNPLASMKRLEDAGPARPHTEAIASEMNDGASGHVTKEQLDAALDKQTLKMSIIVAGILTLACTILGTLISVLVSH